MKGSGVVHGLDCVLRGSLTQPHLLSPTSHHHHVKADPGHLTVIAIDGPPPDDEYISHYLQVQLVVLPSPMTAVVVRDGHDQFFVLSHVKF